MISFIVRFLTCNLLIALFIGLLLSVKYLLQNRLPGRMHYRLWFLLLIILAVPLLPALPIKFHPFGIFAATASPKAGQDLSQVIHIQTDKTSDWLNDFTMSVTRDAPSAAGYLLFGIWVAGILAVLFFVAKSNICFSRIRKSALPLQNPEVCSLYQSCLAESGISRKIPIYSTAFLKSPVFTGLFRPCIYLPIHLISDLQKTDLRYMLLHELQHYKHRDTLPHFLMNLALMFYWFNPMVWLAFLEMRCDRELACDSSVLEMLSETDYEEYGQTLLRFAYKISDTPFPFAASFHSGMKQMKRRILQIASYQKPSAAARYLREIGYGNETIGTDLSSYWMKADLKISPLEQVILLSNLYEGKLPFAPEHVAAVLEALSIPNSEIGTLYGKTGTGRVNGKDVNGWFLGYVEGYGQGNHTIFFAVNIRGKDQANGSTAARLLTDILTE